MDAKSAKVLELERENSRRGMVSCGAGTAHGAFAGVGDLQTLSPPADEDSSILLREIQGTLPS